MDRSIAEIEHELGTVDVRLNMLAEESRNIDSRGERLSRRRRKLKEELEEAQNA